MNDATSVALFEPSTSSLLAPSTPIRPDASAKLAPSAHCPDSRRAKSPPLYFTHSSGAWYRPRRRTCAWMPSASSCHSDSTLYVAAIELRRASSARTRSPGRSPARSRASSGRRRRSSARCRSRARPGSAPAPCWCAAASGCARSSPRAPARCRSGRVTACFWYTPWSSRTSTTSSGSRGGTSGPSQ